MAILEPYGFQETHSDDWVRHLFQGLILTAIHHLPTVSYCGFADTTIVPGP